MTRWSGNEPSLVEVGTGLQLVGRKNPALTEVAMEVTPGPGLEMIASRMLGTLRRTTGHAIAAPQVGRRLRLVVLVDGTVYLNPTLDIGDVIVNGMEGCLSLPGRFYEVPRATQVGVHATNLAGKPLSFSVDGFEARLWQHEVDHLEGLLLEGRFERLVHPERYPTDWQAAIG